MFSNNVEAHLTPFIGNLVGNVCTGVATALKTPKPIKNLIFELEGESVRIVLNHNPIPLNLSHGFSRIIVADTIRGMLRHLKMDDPDGIIRIEIETI